MKRFLFSVCAIVFCGVCSFGQTYYFEQYSVEEGMPVSKVYYLLQDNDGYLWMGTETGVVKFDGARIFEYAEDDGVAPRPVRSIMQDNSGKIWMGHEGGGITVYEKGQFIALSTDSLGITSDVTSIIEDAENNIWISTYGSGALKVADEDWSRTTHYMGAQGLSDRVVGAEVLHTGEVIFITDAGLKKAIGDEFKNYEIPDFPAFYQITTLFEDAKQTLWIGTHNGGLYYRQKDASKMGFFDSSHGLASNWVTSLTATPNGDIWVGSWGGGLTRIRDGKTKVFNHRNGVQDRKIRHLITDREGNVMIGTNESGLYIYKGEQFVSYTEKDGLRNNQVWAISEDQRGNMWFGTNNGITVLPAEGGDARPRHYHLGNFLNANNVRFIKRDNNGNFWVAMWGGGVQQYNSSRGSFQIDSRLNDEIGISGNVTAFELFDEHMWVGTVNGLVHYNFKSREIERFTQTDGLPGNDISVIYQINDREVWIGIAGDGLTRYDLATGTFQSIDIGTSITPQSLAQSAGGSLYIGTKSNGIIELQDQVVKRTYSTDDGLLGDYIALLTTDSDNNLWVGTNRGLNKIDVQLNTVYTFPEKIGFTGIEAKTNAVYTDSQGNIWFGTVNGAIRNSPVSERHNQLPPLINISDLTVNGVPHSWSNNLELEHDQSTLRIDFTGICFTNSEEVQYQVFLEGANEQWENIGHQNYISYPLLRPGVYQFKVKAANNEGVWNEEPASLDFVILPPWYQTKVFYSGLGVLVLLSVFSFIKIRERNLKRVNRVLEEKVEERTREVVEQSREIDRQKGEIERLLLNILPRNISEELRKKGKATAGHYDMVSVLFTDFKGFTNFSERLRPDDLIKELDECFMGFDDIIDDHYIEKIKTIGDAYMCAGGIPIRNKSNPIDVVLAGLRIREFMKALREKKERETGESYWEIRIGIHTGPLVAGVVGKRKFAYDIWGDTVNTASRMESSGEAGKVNISGTTYELVKKYFVCTYRGKVAAKNKGEIDMYFVDRIKPEYAANPKGTLPNERLKKELSQIV